MLKTVEVVSWTSVVVVLTEVEADVVPVVVWLVLAVVWVMVRVD